MKRTWKSGVVTAAVLAVLGMQLAMPGQASALFTPIIKAQFTTLDLTSLNLTKLELLPNDTYKLDDTLTLQATSSALSFDASLVALGFVRPPAPPPPKDDAMPVWSAMSVEGDLGIGNTALGLVRPPPRPPIGDDAIPVATTAMMFYSTGNMDLGALELTSLVFDDQVSLAPLMAGEEFLLAASLGTITFSSLTLGADFKNFEVFTRNAMLDFSAPAAGMALMSMQSGVPGTILVARVVPEPGTLLLLGSGVLGLAGVQRKKRSKVPAN